MTNGFPNQNYDFKKIYYKISVLLKTTILDSINIYAIKILRKMSLLYKFL